MEIEFLTSLNHNVGISDEAYLGWLDVLGNIAMTAAHARYSVYQPIAPSDYPFTFEASYHLPSYDLPPPIRHRGRSTSAGPHRQFSKTGKHDMPALQQAINAIEIEPTSSASTSPLSGPANKKRSAAQVFSAGPEKPVRRIKSTQGTQRRGTSQRLFAGHAKPNVAFDNSGYAINDSVDTVPPPSMASYQMMAPLSMAATDFSMANESMSMQSGPAEMGYLQLPYDYRMGYQPRQEVSLGIASTSLCARVLIICSSN